MLYLRPSQPKLLMPVPKWEWRTPSQAQPKDCFGHENQTRFRLTARLNDGHIVWRGWFDDRDDADAFLFALASGSLEQERPLWRLPTPSWHPDLGESLSYEFVTLVFVVSGTTKVMPSDWNSVTNNIYALAPGGAGAQRNGGNATGGGSGSYAGLNNFNVAAGATVNVQIGTGGVGGALSGNPGSADTWLNKTTNAAPAVVANGLLAKLGGGGQESSSGPNSGGTGGLASASVGDVTQNGGTGGNANSGTNATGGGGAPTNGNDGGTPATNSSTGGSSGSGLAGGAGGNNGSNGTDWDASHGSGSGGGAANSSSASGSGGQYGAGGGANRGLGNSGAGGDGIIVLSYTPQPASMFNLAAPH